MCASPNGNGTSIHQPCASSVSPPFSNSTSPSAWRLGVGACLPCLHIFACCCSASRSHSSEPSPPPTPPSAGNFDSQPVPHDLWKNPLPRILITSPAEQSSDPQTSEPSTSTMADTVDFNALRAETLGAGRHEEAVTVNTRALIDKGSWWLCCTLNL